MTNWEGFELRVLGPLEARVDGVPIPLGGAKQRGLLAVLALRASEVVSTSALVEEIWGEKPPASAAHSLEVYVSRLRRVLDVHATIVKRGVGYVLEVADDALDARRFARLAEAATLAAADEEDELVERTSCEALRLWRGPVCSDLALGPSGHVEAERLEETRLLTLELRFDAELDLGLPDASLADLRAVVREHPYRQRFVAQLMLAMYRAGRHADGLAIYEQTRRGLDEELGLQPSLELQQLSARIVRQEPGLDPQPAARAPRHPPEERRPRRIAGLVVAGALVTSAMALTANGSAPVRLPALDTGSGRVALVLPAQPKESSFDESVDNSRLTWTTAGFEGAAGNYGFEPSVLEVDEIAPDDGEIDRLEDRIAQNRYDLVILQGDRASAPLVARHVMRHPGTRFVFLDTSLEQLSLEGVANATAVRFVVEHPARMAGVAIGLSYARKLFGRDRADGISVVAGVPDSETRRMVTGFERGVHTVLPNARVRVGYTRETGDLAPCERLANKQVDGGAELIFVVAGRCGGGAAAVAHTRGVRVIGEDEYGMNGQPWVVASMFKDWKQAPQRALDAYVDGTLPAGGDLELGVDDNYATGLGMSDAIPSPVQSQVVDLCTRIRLLEESAELGRRTAGTRT